MGSNFQFERSMFPAHLHVISFVLKIIEQGYVYLLSFFVVAQDLPFRHSLNLNLDCRGVNVRLTVKNNYISYLKVY